MGLAGHIPLWFHNRPKPTIDWSFMGAIPSSLTYARASSGTYFGVDGLLKTAANNEPRFEYDPITHEAKGLLLEASATNLAYPSEDFSTSWNSTNATETPNVTLAPSGLVTGNSWVRTSTSSSCLTSKTITKDASSLPYCSSVYAKRGTLGRYLAMRIQGTYPNRLDACFDLEGGVVTSSSTGGSGFTNTLVKIEPVGGGWHRCIIASSTSDTGTAIRPLMSFNSTASNQVDTTTDPLLSDGYLWGAQLEAGTFATSYIPTYGAAATRAADSLYTTSIPWFNPEQGTCLVKVDIGSFSNYPNPFSFVPSGILQMATGGALQHFNGISYLTSTSSTTVNTRSTAGFVYTTDTVSRTISLNGDTPKRDSGVPWSSAPTKINLGSGGSSNQCINGHLRSFKYWNRALPNTELQRITS